MKVLMINGSPNANGNTAIALNEMKQIFESEGIEVHWLHIGKMNIHGCVACKSCKENGQCVFDDVVNDAAKLLEECDGMVVGSPVYYGGPNATVAAFMDRLFYSSKFDKTMKVGAAVASARRGGLGNTMDQLNKYFSISGMPIASSQYWNDVHGMQAGQAAEDREGLQTMRVLAKNMSFLMKSIELGKEKYGLPEKENRVWTHFIR